MSTIQGNFLSPAVQQQVRDFVRDANNGRPNGESTKLMSAGDSESDTDEPMREDDLIAAAKSKLENEQNLEDGERMVDVVLSDMSAPWDQTTGFWKRSLSDPYRRMMNTSGVSFRDHIGSMVCVSLTNMECKR